MLNKERARIFMPFDAISGFREGLEKACKKSITKKSISEEMECELNTKLKEIKKEDKVKVIYYYNLDYNEVIGNVKKIDEIYKVLLLDNTNISFDDILDVIKI